jgi:hypothetical protein
VENATLGVGDVVRRCREDDMVQFVCRDSFAAEGECQKEWQEEMFLVSLHDMSARG